MNSMTDPPDLPIAERAAQLWSDSVGWMTNHSTRIIIAVIIGAVIVTVLLSAKWLGQRICQTGARRDWRVVIGRALSATKLWFMIAVAAQVVATFAHAPTDVAHVIRFLFVIAVTLQGTIFARELIVGAVEHRAQGHESLGSAINIIRLLVTVALFAIAVVLILSNLGVNVTGLVAGLGIGGIAIGLAAQGIFKDLFAALAILFDRPFRVGEIIKFGDATGRVEAIGLKTTRIRSLDGEQIIMSNDKLLDTQIRNLANIEERRVILTLPLHYGNTSDRLAALPDQLKAMVEAVPDTRFDHAVLLDFADNAVKLELMFHTNPGAATVRDTARHVVMLGTMKLLAEQGVAFSFQAAQAALTAREETPAA